MRPVADLIKDFVEPISILLFGPSLESEQQEEIARGLQDKRREIRTALEENGHHVLFGEEVVDPALPPPTDNPFLQELVLMGEYDLIVVLMQTPGTIVEATMIALNAQLARKTILFVCDRHRDGLPRKTCSHAELLGADVREFIFPDDVTDCHLLAGIVQKVREVQIVKAFS